MARIVSAVKANCFTGTWAKTTQWASRSSRDRLTSCALIWFLRGIQQGDLRLRPVPCPTAYCVAAGTIGLTFRDQAGEICRSFMQQSASGLACRSGGRWQLKGLFAPPEGQGTNYRMAAGMDPNLAALVDSTMAGEPFDAIAEKAAKQRGWH